MPSATTAKAIAYSTIPSSRRWRCRPKAAGSDPPLRHAPGQRQRPDSCRRPDRAHLLDPRREKFSVPQRGERLRHRIARRHWQWRLPRSTGTRHLPRAFRSTAGPDARPQGVRVVPMQRRSTATLPRFVTSHFNCQPSILFFKCRKFLTGSAVLLELVMPAS